MAKTIYTWNITFSDNISKRNVTKQVQATSESTAKKEFKKMYYKAPRILDICKALPVKMTVYGCVAYGMHTGTSHYEFETVEAAKEQLERFQFSWDSALCFENGELKFDVVKE